MKNNLLFKATMYAVFLSVCAPFPSFGDNRISPAVPKDKTTIPAESVITLEVPVFSPHFDETPVALVNDEPITLRELREALSALHAEAADQGATSGKGYRKILERLINTRLIILEARNIGLDETETMQGQLKDFAENFLLQKLIQNQLKDVKPDDAEVAELYRQMSRELRLTTLVFKKKEDAGQFLEKVDAGGDFDALAKVQLETGKAEQNSDERYIKQRDLLPQVAEAVRDMEPGSVSRMYQSGTDFIVFKVDDIRFVEDPDVEQQARKIVLDQAKTLKARELSDSLIEKYVTLDKELFEELDFETEKTGYLWFAKERPVDFKKMEQDDRPLAVINSDPPITITVGDFTKELKGKFFHGVDKAVKSKSINKRKDVVLNNMLFHETALIEARSQGLDQTDDYRNAIKDFENSALFSVFVDKAIIPDVKLSNEELQAYYEEHLDEFSSPVMLRMNSLVFRDMADAKDALAKLRKGADFKWVSANTAGLVAKEEEGVLEFDKTLLSVATLPEGLRELVKDPREGDKVLYADPEKFYYVLVLEDVYPAKAEPYNKVRKEIAKKVFDNKIKELVNNWTEKLKDAYKIRSFLSSAE